MTETQQKCFMAVAEHLSFSKAAEVLYVSQPAISKNISALEAEVGTPLFSRQGKTVTLTRAGEIFRDFITEYDNSYRYTLERMGDLERDIHAGNVVIGCDTTWNAVNFYPAFQKHFCIADGNGSVTNIASKAEFTSGFISAAAITEFGSSHHCPT